MEVTGQSADVDKWQELLRLEAERALELGSCGILRRLWRIPGRLANWGLWAAADIDELHNAIASLPLFPFLTVTVHPLASHPNDPRQPLDKE